MSVCGRPGIVSVAGKGRENIANVEVLSIVWCCSYGVLLFVVAWQGLDAAWLGRFSWACTQERERASQRESFSRQGSMSHFAR